MSHQLPPKRYEDPGESRFDWIRHLPWYPTLFTRREKIAALEQASIDRHYTNIVYTDDSKRRMSQKEAADKWAVDERELRDYEDFKDGRSRFSELSEFDKRNFQYLLDQSYEVYVANGAERPISKIIHEQSRLFGVNARHVVELWEVDPHFYPSVYRGTRN